MRQKLYRAYNEPESSYVYEKIANLVLLIDLDLGRNVTSDVHHVVDDLECNGTLQPGDRLVYRDSNGDWDEILLDRGAGLFRYLGRDGLHKALASAALDAMADTIERGRTEP